LLNDIYQPTNFLVDTSYGFKAMSRTMFKVKKWTKGNNPKIREGRMTIVQCISTKWDLYTYKVSCWYLLFFQSYVPDKIGDGESGNFCSTICSRFMEHIIVTKISANCNNMSLIARLFKGKVQINLPWCFFSDGLLCPSLQTIYSYIMKFKQNWEKFKILLHYINKINEFEKKCKYYQI
jgi:hypothetical protein